jgi:hypothetical protein
MSVILGVKILSLDMNVSSAASRSIEPGLIRQSMFG